MSESRPALIQGLRQLADFLEAHPEAPLSHVHVMEYIAKRDQFKHVARVMGNIDKTLNDDFFGIERCFGPVVYRIFTDRGNICERIVTGKRTIPAQPEHEEDIVEWSCAEPLLWEMREKEQLT